MGGSLDATSNPNGARAWQTCICLGVFTTLAVILRLLARWKSKANFGIDDYLIVVSLIPLYVMVVLSFLIVSIGHFGLPISTLPPSDIPFLLKMLVSSILTYSLAITMVKVSVLLLYRRIFATPGFRLKSLVVGVVCVLWFFIAVFTGIFQCRPFSAVFDIEMLFTDHCIDIQAYYWGISASNVFLDLVVLSLPIHEVWKLQLPMQKKFILSGIFMLGGLVCIAGIMRTVTISDLETGDLTVTLVPQYQWSLVEPALAITCACIVTYRPLFANFNLDFSKISAILSRHRSNTVTNKGVITESSGTHMSQPHHSTYSHDPQLAKLNAKAASKGLHIVHIDLGSSESRSDEGLYKQPKTRHILRQGVQEISEVEQ